MISARRHMLPILVQMVMLANNCASSPNSSAIDLEAGFADPPQSARPGAFWPWLNGQADRERLRFDLQQMKEKGMSGAEIWDVQAMRNTDSIPAGPEFLSPESVDRIHFALNEAKKLGLRMGMITSSGWNAGGTWVTPDWASKLLVSSTTETTGPVTFSDKLPFPEVPEHCPKGENGLPIFYRDVCVLAVPYSDDKVISSTDEVINLTDRLQPDGTLSWEVPEGRYRILRFVCTNTGQELIVPSPKSKGLFIDFLDPEATRRHLQTIMDRLKITPENAKDSGLHYLEVDSMELHKGTPWTDKFANWFKKYRGYDLTLWMPVLAGWTVNDKASSKAFMYDYRRTVSDLLIHSHYETGSEFLSRYGMEFVGEAGGPGPPIWKTCPVDALKALGNVTVPRGEFWIKHRNMFLIKEVASAAHIYGKPISDAEAFTTWRRWEDSPFALKMVADRAFAEGMNRLTIHTFSHSPDYAGLPGWAYHAGVDINPNTTWWPYARLFFDYLARCSYMLQQGLPVSDVLWYYGDQAPNFFPAHHDVPDKPRLPGLSRGYDFDVVNSDVILNRLQVENGRFVLPEGTSYRILAFPDSAAMPVEVMQKLEELTKQGGIIVGNPPKASPGLHERAKRTRDVKELGRRLWADAPTSAARNYGSGRVYWHQPLDAVLAAEKVQEDFRPADENLITQVDYIHRRTADRDIYYVRNEVEHPVNGRIRFRTPYRSAELWNPATSERIGLSVIEPGNETVAVDLQLDPGDAKFVVFRNTSTLSPAPRSNETTEPLSTLEEWTLTFPKDAGATEPVLLTDLKSWTEIEHPLVKHFAGTVIYRSSFGLPNSDAAQSTKLILDLGQVHDVAEVYINGKSAGAGWKPPYRFDMTKLANPGNNEIQIHVTNLWHNRLVGDAHLEVSDRITTSNHPLPPKESGLLTSGLLGPLHLVKDGSATIEEAGH